MSSQTKSSASISARKFIPSDAEVISAAREKNMISPEQIARFQQVRKIGEHYSLALKEAGVSLGDIISLDRHLSEKYKEKMKRISQRLNGVKIKSETKWYENKTLRLGLASLIFGTGVYVLYSGIKTAFGGEAPAERNYSASISQSIDGKLTKLTEKSLEQR